MADKKSVVQIQVDDADWKKFAEEFKKFKVNTEEQLEATREAVQEEGKLAAARRKSDKAEKEGAAKAKAERVDQAKSDKSTLDTQKKKQAAQEKAALERKKQRADDLQHLKNAAKWTADVARNVASTAFSAAKWASFGAIASGFGLGGLGASASNARRQSQGLGINTGELRAANVNFGKYIDPEAALGNIANAKDDQRLQWLFQRVGQSTTGKNAGDILPEILPKLVAAFRQLGGKKDVAEAQGLTELVGFEDLRRLSSLTEKELSATIEAYRVDREKLDVTDDTNRAWQDFIVNMKRAGEGIEVSLIKSLKTLTPFLEAFAAGIAKAIDTFVSSGGLQAWIEKVGAALERLGNYLGSKEFQSDVESFMSAIHTMAVYLGKLFPKSQAAQETAQGTASSMPAAGAKPAEGAFSAAMGVYRAIWDHLTGKTPLAERNHNPGNLRIPGSTTGFQSFKSDDDGIKALAHQLTLYENRDGLRTIRGIISKYAPGNENNTAAYIENVSKRTGLGADQTIDPANMDQMVKLILAITKQENGRSNFTDAGVRVVIQNQTGGSAQATVAALNH